MRYPFHIITGEGLGYSCSSLAQVGDVINTSSLGEANIGVYLNLSNDNVTIEDRSVVMADCFGNLNFRYIYNRQAKTTAEAWRFPIKRLSLLPNGQIAKLIEKDGHETVYSNNTLHPNWPTYYFAPGLGDGTPFLKHDDVNNQWVWYHPKTKVTEIYDDQTGELIESRNHHGVTIRYEYPKNSSTKYIVHANGGVRYELRQVSAKSGHDEHLVMVYPDGLETILQIYHFDDQQRLEYSMSPPPTSYKVTYEYAIAHELIQITQDDKTIAIPRVGPDGSLGGINIGDDSASIFFNKISATEYQVTHGVGLNLKISTDANQRITRLEKQTGFSDFNPDGTSNQFSFDKTEYGYVPTGQLKSITPPHQQSETFEYNNLFGLLTKHEQQVGDTIHSVEFIYSEASGERPELRSVVRALKGVPDTYRQAITRYIHANTPTGPSVNPQPDDKRDDFMRFMLSAEGSVSQNDYSNSGGLETQRHYLNDKFPVADLQPGDQPMLSHMLSWTKESKRLQQSRLIENQLDRHNLPSVTSYYAHNDEKGVGIHDEQMGKVENSWNDFVGQCAGKTIKISNTLSHATTEFFDTLGRTESFTDGEQKTSYGTEAKGDTYRKTITRPNGRKETKISNNAGIITDHEVIAADASGKLQTRHTTAYLDEQNEPGVKLCADGRRVYQWFDRQSRLIYEISTTGQVTEYNYDAEHNVTMTLCYSDKVNIKDIVSQYFPDRRTRDGDHLVQLLKPLRENPKNRRSYTIKDAKGRLRFSIDAAGYVQEHRYDSTSYYSGDHPISIISYADKLTANELQGLLAGGKMHREINPAPGKDRLISQYYNLDGFLIATIDGAGYVVEYKRDASNRVTEKILYHTPNLTAPRSDDFSLMRPAESPDDAHTHYFRDNRGKVELMINAEGFVTTYERNADGSIKNKIQYKNKVYASWYHNTDVRPPAPKKHAEDLKTEYDYDDLQRVIQIKRSDHVSTKVEYSIMGHADFHQTSDDQLLNATDLELMEDPTMATSPDFIRRRYKVRDGFGQVVQATTPYIGSRLIAIDANNQLTPEQKAEEKRKVMAQMSHRHQFDNSGLHISSLDTQNNRTVFYYDDERRLVLTIDAEGRVVKQGWNAFNQIEKTSRPTGRLTEAQLEKLTGGFLDATVSALVDELLEKPDTVHESFEYEGRGLQSLKVDGAGNEWHTAWNAFSEKDVELLPTILTKPSIKIEHSYENRGLEVKKETTNLDTQAKKVEMRQYQNLYGKCTAITDADGNTIRHEHDKLGNDKRLFLADDTKAYEREFDHLNRVISSINAENNVAKIVFKQQDRSKTQFAPQPADSKAESKINRWTKTNVFNEPVKMANALTLDTPAELKHEPDGQICEAMDVLGCKDIHTHDDEGFNDSVTDKVNITTKRESDKTHLLQRSIENFIDTPSDIDEETEEKIHQRLLCDGERIFDRDRHTNLTTIIQRDGLRRSFLKTNARGVDTRTDFNLLSQPEVVIHDPNTSTSTGLNLRTEQQFNAQHQRQSVIQGDDKEVNQYQVNFHTDDFLQPNEKIIDPIVLGCLEEKDAGRAAQEKTPLNIHQEVKRSKAGKIIAQIDGVNHVTWFFYDKNGNTRFAINPKLGVTEWVYDNMQRKHQRRRYEKPLDLVISDETTLAEIEAAVVEQQLASVNDTRTYYFYNANSKPVYQVDVYTDLKTGDLKGDVSATAYNDASQKTARIAYAKSIAANDIDHMSTADIDASVSANQSPKDRYLFYVNDRKGQPRFSIDSRGVVIEQRFDGKGRIIQRIEYSTFLTQEEIQSYKLKSDIELQSLMAAKAKKSDRITTNIFSVFNKPDFVIDGNGVVIRYQHNEVGTLEATCRFDQKVDPQLSYDELVKAVSNWQPDPEKDAITTRELDRAERVLKITDPEGYNSYFTHSAINTLKSRTDRNNYIWGMEYDRAKRLELRISPEVKLTKVSKKMSVNDDTGELEITGLEFDEVVRSIQEHIKYDGVNNVIKVAKDYKGDEERGFGIEYDEFNKPVNYYVDDVVDVDDPNLPASFSQLPVKAQPAGTIKRTHARNSKGIVTCLTNENGNSEYKIFDAKERLAFHILANGQVTEYNRNCFGEAIWISQYHNKLDLPQNFATLSYAEVWQLVKNLPRDDNKDSHQYINRDAAGHPVDIFEGVVKTTTDNVELNSLTGAVIWFKGLSDDETVSEHYRHTKRSYSAFSQVVLREQLIFPAPHNVWFRKFSWFDNAGKQLATASGYQDEFDAIMSYVPTRSQYNSFDDLLSHRVYAERLTQAPTTEMTIEEFDAKLVETIKDHGVKSQYDLRHNVISHTKINVDYAVVGSIEKPNAHYVDGVVDMTTEYKRDGEGNPIKTVLPQEPGSGKNKNDLTKHQAFNAFKFSTACLDRPRYADDQPESNTRAFVRPLVVQGTNAHHQKVRTTSFINGFDANYDLSSGMPTPIPNPDKDETHLTLHDKRGKAQLKQDPNGNLTGETTTLTGKKARTFGYTTVPDLSNDRTEVKKNKHIDETQFGFDALDRPNAFEKMRDGQVQQTLKQQMDMHNIATHVGSGEGSNPLPLRRETNVVGDVVRTNAADGAARIQLPDLMGRINGTLKSTDKNVDLNKTDIFNVDEISKLIQADYKTISMMQDAFAVQGDKVATRLPDIEPEKNPHKYLPSYMKFANGKLRWSIPNTNNARPYMRFYPFGHIPDQPPEVIEAQIVDGCYEVDVSHLNTDLYTCECWYKLEVPGGKDGKPTILTPYYSSTTVGIVTENHETAYNPVAYVTNEAVLHITGMIDDIVSIELYQGDQKITGPIKLTLVGEELVVDLTNVPDLVSGHYFAKPILRDGSSLDNTTEFTVITDVPAPTPIAQNIPCEANILNYNRKDGEGNIESYGQLTIWNTMPEKWQKYPMMLFITYIDETGEAQTLENIEVDPGTFIAPVLSDDKGHQIHPNFKFPTSVKSISKISVAIKFSDTVAIPVYNQDSPIPAEAHVNKSYEIYSRGGNLTVQVPQAHLLTEAPDVANTSEIQTTVFRWHEVMYLTPLDTSHLSGDVKLEYLDVTKGIQAQWQDLPAIGKTANGLTFDVTALPVAKYPFKLPQASNKMKTPAGLPTFWVTQGGELYESEAIVPHFKGEANLPELKTDPAPRKRVRLYGLDSYSHEIKITDCRGNTSTKELNNAGKPKNIKQPPIQVWDHETQSLKTITPQQNIFYGYRGGKIGEQDANGHYTVTPRDDLNRKTQRVLGDGTITQQFKHGLLNSDIGFIDTFGSEWKFDYDRNKNRVKIQIPNSDNLVNDGKPIIREFRFNEKNKRIELIDAENQSSYLGQDCLGFLMVSIVSDPQDNNKYVQTEFKNHPSGKPVYQRDPDGVEMTWTPDKKIGYWGHMSGHKDRSGAEYTITFGPDAKASEIRSSGGNHGAQIKLQRTSVLVPVAGFEYKRVEAIIYNTVSTPGQHLEMERVADRLISITDNANNTQTTYRYDEDDNLVGVEFVDLTTQQTIHATTATINALGWQTQYFDDQLLTGMNGYDAAGNLLYGLMQLHDNVNKEMGKVVSANAFDAANRATAINCELKDGELVVNKDQGAKVEYVHNAISKKHTVDDQDRPVTTTMTSAETGVISRTQTTLDSKPSEETAHTNKVFGANFSILHSESWQQEKNKTTTIDNIYNRDQSLHETTQVVKEGSNTKSSDTTILSYNTTGTVHSQVVHDHKDNVKYTFDQSYTNFDAEEIGAIEGITDDKYGTRFTQSHAYCDSNGTMQAKTGYKSDGVEKASASINSDAQGVARNAAELDSLDSDFDFVNATQINTLNDPLRDREDKDDDHQSDTDSSDRGWDLINASDIDALSDSSQSEEFKSDDDQSQSSLTDDSYDFIKKSELAEGSNIEDTKYEDTKDCKTDNPYLAGASNASTKQVDQAAINNALSGLSFEKIRSDGHCLFRAVCLQAEKESSDQAVFNLRARVADRMRNGIDRDDFRQFFSEDEQYQAHIETIGSRAEWADHIEIEVIQRILDRPIIIFQSNANLIIPDNVDNYRGEPVFVYYNGIDHYDAFQVAPGSNARDILSTIRSCNDKHWSITFTPKAGRFQTFNLQAPFQADATKFNGSPDGRIRQGIHAPGDYRHPEKLTTQNVFTGPNEDYHGSYRHRVNGAAVGSDKPTGSHFGQFDQDVTGGKRLHMKSKSTALQREHTQPALSTTPHLDKNQASTKGLARKLHVADPIESIGSSQSYPKTFTVPEEGMTVKVIAAEWMGHPEAAAEIALYNGLSGPDAIVQKRVTLNAPPMLPDQLTAKDFTPYSIMNRMVVGQLLPALQFAQPPQHHNCFEVILGIVISIVAIIVAPELAPVIGSATSLLTSIVDGIVAAAIDAGLQGIAVGVGLLHHFSWTQVLETGIAAGTLHYFGMDKISMGMQGIIKMTAAQTFRLMGKAMMVYGAINMMQQLSELALGMRKDFNVRALFAAMVTGALDQGINIGLAKLCIPSVLLNNFVTSFVDSTVNGLVGSAIMGVPPDVENMMEQMIGSFAGGEIGHEMNHFLMDHPPSYTTIGQQQRVDEQFMHQMEEQEFKLFQQGYFSGNGISQLPGLGQMDPDGLDPFNFSVEDVDQQLTSDTNKQLSSHANRAAGSHAGIANPHNTVVHTPPMHASANDASLAGTMTMADYRAFDVDAYGRWLMGQAFASTPSILSEAGHWLVSAGKAAGGLWVGMGDSISYVENEFKYNFTGTTLHMLEHTGQFIYDQINELEYVATGGAYGDRASVARNAALTQGIVNFFSGVHAAGLNYQGGYMLGLGLGPMVLGSLTGAGAGIAAEGLGGLGGLRQVSLFRSGGVESSVARRTYLDAKFGRTGNLHVDISRKGYFESLQQFDYPANLDSKIFYSGVSNNLKAEIFSQMTGKLTIDRLSVGIWLKNQALYRVFDGSNQVIADEVWEEASRQYAASARGQVYVFANGANPARIFNMVELPILKASPLVTDINYLDHPYLDFDHFQGPKLDF